MQEKMNGIQTANQALSEALREAKRGAEVLIQSVKDVQEAAVLVGEVDSNNWTKQQDDNIGGMHLLCTQQSCLKDKEAALQIQCEELAKLRAMVKHDISSIFVQTSEASATIEKISSSLHRQYIDLNRFKQTSRRRTQGLARANTFLREAFYERKDVVKVVDTPESNCTERLSLSEVESSPSEVDSKRILDLAIQIEVRVSETPTDHLLEEAIRQRDAAAKHADLLQFKCDLHESQHSQMQADLASSEQQLSCLKQTCSQCVQDLMHNLEQMTLELERSRR